MQLFAWTPAVSSYLLPAANLAHLQVQPTHHYEIIAFIMIVKIINEHSFNYDIFLLKSLRVFSLLWN